MSLGKKEKMMKKRFALGFILGTIMSALSLILAGPGEGTYAPMALNASFLYLAPLLALIGTPFLWAAYYAYIPTIQAFRTRLIVTAAVLLLHIAAGVLDAWNGHYAFETAFRMARPIIEGYLVIANLTMIGLVICSYVGAAEPTDAATASLGQ